MGIIHYWEAVSRSAAHKFPTIYGTQGFITVFTSPPRLSNLSQIDPFNTTPSYLSWSFLILPTYLPIGLLLISFIPNFSLILILILILMYFCSPHSCYMLCSTHYLWMYHPNYAWRRVRIMELLIMRLSPTSYYFITDWFKYSPQHPLLRHINVREQISQPHKPLAKIIVLSILIFKFSDSRRGD
jgi:hypothetical protein